MPKNGSGRIYQQAGSAVWWLDYGYRGKRYRESTRTTKKGEANQKLRERLGQIGAGAFIGPDAERLTLDDMVVQLQADYRKMERGTWDRAAQSVKHLRDYFGPDARARDITTSRMNAYVLSRMDEGAANATIRRELAALSKMFAIAVENGDMPTRPKVPSVAVNNVRKGFLDGGELEGVIEELPTELKPVVRFAALTGWRRGEILTLTWRKVDFQAGTIRLDPGETKNKDGRTFPFRALAPLSDLLEAQREHTNAVERETGSIITHVFHRRGAPILDLRAAWSSACTRAGVPDMLFHDLRRTSVRNLVRAGVPEKTSMKLVGHKTRSIFDRYNIVNDADLVDGVEKLAQRLGATTSTARKVVPLAR